MKTMLTCDDVFEVLTRAPFPASDLDDESIETHLGVCHECRCLAEALRPAIGLFHEAIDDDSALPMYCGRFHASERTAKGRRSTSRAGRSWTRFGAGVMAASLVMAFGLMWTANLYTPSNEVRPSVAVRPLADRDVVRLASMQLPDNCIEQAPPQAANRLIYDCCTKCHRADSAIASSPAAIVKSSAACLACHEWYSVSGPRPSRGLLGCLLACDTAIRVVAWE